MIMVSRMMGCCIVVYFCRGRLLLDDFVFYLVFIFFRKDRCEFGSSLLEEWTEVCLMGVGMFLVVCKVLE